MTNSTFEYPSTTSSLERLLQPLTESSEDQALVQQCLKEDEAARFLLYATHYPDLMKYVERHWPGSRGHYLADEVVTHVLHSLLNRNFARLPPIVSRHLDGQVDEEPAEQDAPAALEEL